MYEKFNEACSKKSLLDAEIAANPMKDEWIYDYRNRINFKVCYSNTAPGIISFHNHYTEVLDLDQEDINYLKTKYFMEKFTAKDAKNLYNDTILAQEIEIAIKLIKDEASKSTKVHIYRGFRDETLKEIEDRGFSIYKHPSISIQKDNLYYTISW